MGSWPGHHPDDGALSCPFNRTPEGDLDFRRFMDSTALHFVVPPRVNNFYASMNRCDVMRLKDY
jgi:hypothetical protein